MKVELKSSVPVRKLIAVIGDSGVGIFFRAAEGSIYIDPEGFAKNELSFSLEELIEGSSLRTPVYEGDEVKLIF